MTSVNPPIMELLRKGNPLDWGGLDRTLLLMVVTNYVPVVFLFSLYFFENSELVDYLDLAVVEFCRMLCWASMCLNWVFMALGLWQRKYRRNWPFLSHGLAQIYTLGMLASVWITGTYTSNNSLLLIAGLALALPLLDQKVVFFALVSGILASIVAVAATEAGHIRYAPLFTKLPFQDGIVSPTWAVTQFVLVVNTIAAVWVIMASLIKRWRVREKDLLAQMENQDKLASLGEFSARIIHQTRHQLGLMGISVHNLTEHLDQQIESGKALDVEMIRDVIQRLGDVQNKLRQTLKEDLNMEPSGELSDQRSYCEILKEEVENLQHLAMQSGVALRLQISEAESKQCFPLLPEEWGQGLFNVIENAISAAKQQVSVVTTIHEGHLQISVTDDGEGIPELLMARVMQPFITTKPDGSGMGLAIADGVTQKEGGSLQLSNREEGGLQVVFILPLPLLDG